MRSTTDRQPQRRYRAGFRAFAEREAFHFRRTTRPWYRRPMTIDSLEKEVLRLPPEERARLAELLLSSLDELSVSDLERVWFAEAQRRAEQVDSGAVQLIPSEEVEKKARSILR